MDRCIILGFLFNFHVTTPVYPNRLREINLRKIQNHERILQLADYLPDLWFYIPTSDTHSFINNWHYVTIRYYILTLISVTLIVANKT